MCGLLNTMSNFTQDAGRCNRPTAALTDQSAAREPSRAAFSTYTQIAYGRNLACLTVEPKPFALCLNEADRIVDPAFGTPPRPLREGGRHAIGSQHLQVRRPRTEQSARTWG